jgi:hypothetical protein
MTAKPPTVFWGNERVTHTAIVGGQSQATLQRLASQGRVLMVQDTTSFDFAHHPATGGMGTLENQYCRGFLAHSTLAVSSEGLPLGLMEQQVWVRSDDERGKRQQRHETAFTEKESYKWVRGLPEAQLEAAVTVCDREGHIYEFLDAALDQGIDFIVRASQGRSFTDEGEALFEYVAQQTTRHEFSLSLKRRPDREAREAQVELRFGSVRLNRPARADSQRETLRVQFVEVIEAHPPQGEEAVHWLLLTSLPVETVEQAQEVVKWYSYRWLIERFHYVLKSGCKLEERQLRHEIRLERLLAVYSLVAWKLLWLTYVARQQPELPCSEVLQTHEWQALYAYIQRTPRPPASVPTLHQAVGWIAQLGGFLGRKGDGEPGVKVLWRGWTRLQDIATTWFIAHSLPTIVGNV